MRPDTIQSCHGPPTPYNQEVAERHGPTPLVDLPVSAIRGSSIATLQDRCYDAVTIETFAKTITAVGEIAHPLTVRSTGKGQWEIVDGALRLAAALFLGFTHVPCRVCDLGDDEVVVVAVALNSSPNKGPKSYIERAWAIETALAVLGLRAADFARISPYNSSQISTALKIAGCFPKVCVVEAARQTGMALEVIKRVPRDTP